MDQLSASQGQPISQNLEDIEERKVGTLELERVNEYEGLSKWSGVIKITDGNLEGSWDIDLATNSKSVRERASSGQTNQIKPEDASASNNRGNLDRQEARRVQGELRGQGSDASANSEDGQEPRQGFWQRFFRAFRGGN